MNFIEKGDCMRVNKSYIKPLLLAAAAMLAVAGCSNAEKGTEGSTDSSAETTSETQAVLEKVTYTSSDGSVSIILPDSNWTNTVDNDGKLVFVSEGKGEITIDYADSKEEVSNLAFGSTEKKLVNRLAKLGMNTDSLEISNYSFDKSTGVRRCSYTLKYTDTAAGNYYTVTSVSALTARGYQVSGNVKEDDAALLASVQESVNSFLVLQNPLSAEAESENSGGTGESDGAASVSGEERYFFDEPGNAIYVKQNTAGAWVDENGMEYTFYENGVKDSNGTWYYYDPPAYRSGSSGESSGSSDEGAYYDFYDKDGNYIKATQDANGNWVGDDGKVYTFGEKGVTDSDGNFHPY